MFSNFFHSRLIPSFAMGMLLTIVPFAKGEQDDGLLAVVITNADELVAVAPDSDLAEDVVDALDDRELWRLNINHGMSPNAQTLTQLLIALASPDEITQVGSYSIDAHSNNTQTRGRIKTKSQSRIKGTAIAVGPVADFDRFVAAIDYGRVTDVDDSKWVIHVRIDPKEIAVDQLMARVKKTGRRPPGIEVLSATEDSSMPGMPLAGQLGGPDFDQLPDHRGFPPHRRHKRSSSAPSLSSNRLGSSGVSFGQGDQVKVAIGGVTYEAVIEALEEDDEEDNFRVKLADIQSLARAIKDRALRTRLRRAKDFSLLVPEDRLRLVKAAARPSSQEGVATGPTNGVAHSPRIWNDKTGKFQVIATYAGISGQKVRLLKPSGKEALVPLSRLCSEDQKYVAKALSLAGKVSASPITSTNSPAAPPTPPRELRASWNGVRTVRGKDFPRWTFVPPTQQNSAKIIQPAQRSIDFSRPPSPGPFGEKLLKLAISQDGATAFGIIESGKINSERLYLQELDFAKGKAGTLFALPEESVVLDILPEERLVLLRTDKFGNNENTRLYLQQIGQQGLKPVSSWIPSQKDEFFKDIEAAWFLADGRVMTQLEHGDAYVIWNRQTAQAIFRIPLGNRYGFSIAMDPERRMLAIATDGGVSLIDTSSGKHVATVTHDLNKIKAVALSDDLQRVAIAGKDSLAAWDLTNGESIFEIPLPTNVTAKSLMWVDGRPLLNGRYLFAPDLRVLLWEYLIASWMQESRTQMLGGRLWYAPASDKGMPLYVASIIVPHAPVLETLARMGDPDELLVASPGSKIHITVETDRGIEIEKGLAESVAENLTAAGYVCVDHPEGETLVCHIVCKAVGSQEIRVNMSSSPFPDAWDIVTRQVKPYLSYIAISRGETELWKVGWKAEPGHMIFIQKDESLDDALKRLTTPNVDALMRQHFPSHLTRPGTATPAGAYGSSKLTSEGVVQDYFGKE